MEEQYQTGFHIMVLSAFTVLCLLLDIVIAISGWGNIAIIPVTAAFILCWICHFAKIGGVKQRLYFYVVMMLAVLEYYALRGSSITDIPIILCLMVIILSRNNDKKMICLIAASYLVYLLQAIFITGYIHAGTEQIVFSRIALGMVCLLSAATISIYFMDQAQKENRELQRIKEELKKARKENEVFLSNMSHELRTPINAINGVSGILLNKKLSEDVRDNIDVIRNAGRRIYRQVSDVLDFSEIQTGHFALSKENYEIVSVVNDAISLVFDDKKEKKLDFAIDMENTLPKTLFGDAVRLKKLLICLLDNAWKFTEEGGGYLYISKREEKYGINLNIDLWDTGCGIPSEQQEKLFGGSYLGDNTAERKKGGLGLGLSIAHGIVAAMDGFLSMESSPEKGTHIHVTIPQEVKNIEPSLELPHAERYKVVCYFNKEKYVRAEVGKFYYQVVEHIQTSFHMDLTIAASLDEVKEMYHHRRLTHIYIANWEYGMEPEFFDHIADEIHVCVFADAGFRVRDGSHAEVIYKPIFILEVMQHLQRTLPRPEKGEFALTAEDNTPAKEKKKLALVVDDEDMNLVVAKGILESLGISTETCNGGELAIEKCNIHDYDIIFMDYMMPKMNGTKAMKHIRGIRNGYYKEKPIVVLTANAVSGARESFLEEGFHEFMSKPIELKEMKKVLRKYLDLDTEMKM